MSRIMPLSNIDAAWLHMDDPTNLMMVTGILTFEDQINFDNFKTILEHRLLTFDRFRMRVVEPKVPFMPTYWEEDPLFDINLHLHLVGLPEPAGQKELQDMASDLLSTPLDYNKPLWQIHVIDNYQEGGALIMRLHHSIADGMALIFVLLSMTDMTPDAPLPSGTPPYLEKSGARRRHLLNGTLKAALKKSKGNVKKIGRAYKRFVSESLEVLVNPSHALELTFDGTDHAYAAGRLMLRSNDPLTIFKGDLGVSKRAAWSRPLSLKDVKAIKKAAGATVNDILTSAMTGGLRRYMLARGDKVEGINFRAGIPINMRTPEEMGTLGNKFGLLFLDLPIGVADPLERLVVVHDRMDALKNSKEGSVGLIILNGMGMTPAEIQRNLVGILAAKITAVMTNVPGPPIPLYLAGNKIEDIMFWVPQSGRVALGISILSYANKVYLGVVTDEGLIPDPETIIEGFYQEFDDLMELVALAEG
ncbi:MAG TPA: wax ester/triacylglycerol synthase family O-acyltransferase [Chloroflexi bacterium]|nr:wax ester/triacylglycerol synthase family O-acyltransferase [Chloroflexota bacterium]